MSSTVAVTIAMNLFCAMVDLILLYSVTQMYHLNIKRSRLFLVMIVMNIIALLTSAGNYIDVIASHPVLSVIDNVLLVISFYLIELLFCEMVMGSIRQPDHRTRVLCQAIRIVIILTILFWLLPQFGIVEISGYDMFRIGQIPGWIASFLIMALILLHREELGSRQTLLFLIFLIVPLLGMTARNLNLFYSAQHVATTLSFLLIHTVIHMEQSMKLKEQERQNEENKMQMMLTQIKPHFIYNSLNTIYYLCEIDPASAQKAINEFSDYLRGNLDSLTTNALIPFSKELDHIHHYLYLEKLRFDEDLLIEYDTPVTDFSVPALSIQLLVENAVKHGIGRKSGGGTVTIRTFEETENYVIQVIDNGVGFRPEHIQAKTDERSHIGVISMRERVQAIGGSVNIESEVNTGTTVTVRIPKLH